MKYNSGLYLKGKTILIVEDDYVCSQLIRELLADTDSQRGELLATERAEATGWLRGGRLSPVIWPEGLAAELSQWREGRQGRSVRVQAAAVTATRQPGQQRRRRAGDVDGRAGVDVQRGGAGKGHGRRVAAAVHPGGHEG